MFREPDTMQEAASPVYGEKAVTIRFRCLDLLWRPVGILVRFVAVIHPTRGMILLMCTDVNLAPVEIIRIYSLRFKIELSFKQALRVIRVSCKQTDVRLCCMGYLQLSDTCNPVQIRFPTVNHKGYHRLCLYSSMTLMTQIAQFCEHIDLLHSDYDAKAFQLLCSMFYSFVNPVNGYCRNCVPIGCTYRPRYQIEPGLHGRVLFHCGTVIITAYLPNENYVIQFSSYNNGDFHCRRYRFIQ
jgi:hypothetical protein